MGVMRSPTPPVRSVRSGADRAALRFAVLSLMVASCGGGQSSSDRIATDLDVGNLAAVAITTATSAALTQVGDDSVLVDGLYPGPDGRSVRVWVDVDGKVSAFDPPEPTPLSAVGVWAVDERLFVSGIQCPELDHEAALDNDDGGDVKAVCGDDREAIVSVSLDTGEWQTNGSDLAPGSTTPHAPAGDDGSIVVGSRPGILLDGNGERTPLTGLPDEGAIQICSSPAPLATVSSGGEYAPPTVLPPDLKERNPGELPPLPDEQPRSIAVYRLVGASWQRVSVPADADLASLDPRGCMNEGVLLAGHEPKATRQRIVVIGADGDGVTRKEIEPPGDGVFAPRADGSGDTLIAGTGGGGPIFAWSDGRWTAVGIGDFQGLWDLDYADGGLLVIRRGSGDPTSADVEVIR